MDKEKREFLEIYHPGCLRGEHVPTLALDKHKRVIFICCQNCAIPMTRQDYENFFGVDHDKDINWDEPGDPNDVDAYYSTSQLGDDDVYSEPEDK
jgi:hypothetical protein